MEYKHLRFRPRFRPRTRLSAVIASLFASLLLLFGGDVSGRSHAGLSSAGAMSRSDAGHATAAAGGEARFLGSSVQSERPKLRPSLDSDGYLAFDVQSLLFCRHGHVTLRVCANRLLPHPPLPYWSRAPPDILQTV